MPGKIADANVAISYTDGSEISNRFGAGVHERRENHREKSPMGSLSTVFPVEVMAVLRCTELLLPENATRKKHIWPDSRAPIAAPAQITTESALARDGTQALGKLSGPMKSLQYGYRTSWNKGNEHADKMALTNEGGCSLF
jgi:hypothetical protein